MNVLVYRGRVRSGRIDESQQECPMRRISVLVLASVAVGLGASTTVAQSHEIEVKKHRSFLDSGNVVPVGAENRYFVDSARLSSGTPGGAARRDEFHQGLLPQPGQPIGEAPR